MLKRRHSSLSSSSVFFVVSQTGSIFMTPAIDLIYLRCYSFLAIVSAMESLNNSWRWTFFFFLVSRPALVKNRWSPNCKFISDCGWNGKKKSWKLFRNNIWISKDQDGSGELQVGGRQENNKKGRGRRWYRCHGSPMARSTRNICIKTNAVHFVMEKPTLLYSLFSKKIDSFLCVCQNAAILTVYETRSE